MTVQGGAAANMCTVMQHGNIAAKVARAYTGSGYSDWYLPSKDELNKIYLNKASLGIASLDKEDKFYEFLFGYRAFNGHQFFWFENWFN